MQSHHVFRFTVLSCYVYKFQMTKRIVMLLTNIAAPVDEWNSNSELAFPDDGEFSVIRNSYWCHASGLWCHGHIMTQYHDLVPYHDPVPWPSTMLWPGPPISFLDLLYQSDNAGCYYQYHHYDEGDQIVTNEPCLNCTCHNQMLMCFLRYFASLQLAAVLGMLYLYLL